MVSMLWGSWAPEIDKPRAQATQATCRGYHLGAQRDLPWYERMLADPSPCRPLSIFMVPIASGNRRFYDLVWSEKKRLEKLNDMHEIP